MIAWIRAEVERLNALPCKCVYCGRCNGSGHIRVMYDWLGRPLEDAGLDDLYELEECPECNGHALNEICDRCRQIDELYELDEEAGLQARREQAE